MFLNNSNQPCWFSRTIKSIKICALLNSYGIWRSFNDRFYFHLKQSASRTDIDGNWISCFKLVYSVFTCVPGQFFIVLWCLSLRLLYFTNNIWQTRRWSTETLYQNIRNSWQFISNCVFGNGFKKRYRLIRTTCHQRTEFVNIFNFDKERNTDQTNL